MNEICEDYEIIEEYSHFALSGTVRARIAAGWEPYGRSYTVAMDNTQRTEGQYPVYDIKFYQTMVKIRRE